MRTSTMRTNVPMFAAATLLAALLSAGAIAACDDSSGVHDTPPGTDSGVDTSLPGQDSGNGPDSAANPDASPPPGLDCFPNPTTHDQIINACTDAAKFDKSPTLPLLLADGGVPPLP